MATAVADVPLTRSGRPKVPPLDTVAVHAAAQARIDAAIADAFQHPSRECKAAVRALNAAEKGAPGYAELEAAVQRAATEDQLTAVAHLEAQADDLLREKEGYLYRLALSLHLYEGTRGLSRAIGIGREAFSKRVSKALDGASRSLSWGKEEGERLAREHRIRRYGDAAIELPKVAREVAEARAIKILVRPTRNELIKELASQGATRVHIADIIGREPSRVSHIVTGRGR